MKAVVIHECERTYVGCISFQSPHGLLAPITIKFLPYSILCVCCDGFARLQIPRPHFSHTIFFPTKMCHTFPLAWYLLRCIDHIRHSCPFLASSVTGSSRNHICTYIFLFLGVRTVPLSMFIFRLFYSPPFKSSVPNTMFLLDISPTTTPATARFLIRRTIVVALRKFRLHSVRVVWHTTQADSSSAWLRHISH